MMVELLKQLNVTFCNTVNGNVATQYALQINSVAQQASIHEQREEVSACTKVQVSENMVLDCIMQVS